jgi:hypothetical protein
MARKDFAFKERLVPKRFSITASSTDLRIKLPSEFAGLISWLSDMKSSKNTEPSSAWLLLLERGHYRLLSDGQVLANERLNELRELLIRSAIAEDAEEDAAAAEPAEVAASVFRLLPTHVTYDQSWRLSVPDVFWHFKPAESLPRDFIISVSPEGFIEIWYTDVARRATDQLISWT